jgi:hypothetical protein
LPLPVLMKPNPRSVFRLTVPSGISDFFLC